MDLQPQHSVSETRLDYAGGSMAVREITQRQRTVVGGVAVAMLLHFALASSMWCLMLGSVLRSRPHPHQWDWIPQSLAAVALSGVFTWSAWCAWRWKRRSLRLLCIGLLAATALIAIERSLGLYQLRIWSEDGEYAAYVNSL